MSSLTDPASELDLARLATDVATPSRNLEESWDRAARLEAAARELIDCGRHADVVALAQSVARSGALDTYVANSCANVLHWATWRSFDAFVMQSALALAEKGRFAFACDMERLLEGRQRLPFFVSAFMPKSGGTYLSGTLERTFGYLPDISYVFGGDLENALSPARVAVLAATGGVTNHAHLAPSAWNFSVLRELGVPLWVHLRDPRDAFLSMLHMVELEHERVGPDADAFYAHLEAEAGGRTQGLPLDELAPMLDSFFETICRWVRGWLDFECERKIVTRHADLVADEDALFRALSRFAGLAETARQPPTKTYADARFFQGTNGRWRSELGGALVQRMNATMEALQLHAFFPNA